MRALKAVFKFELGNYIKSRAFKVITILFVSLAIIASFLPHIIPFFTGPQGETADKPKLIVSAGETVIDALIEAYPDYAWTVAGDASDIEKGILDKTYAFGYVINDAGYTVYRHGSSPLSSPPENLEIMLKETALKKVLMAEGAYSERIAGIMDSEMAVNYVTVGKDAMQSFGFAYVMLFILYISIILYGQYVLVSVVTEKTSKMMELLITSAKSTTFMFGKVLGAGTAGLIQLVIVLMSLYLGVVLNKDAWMSFAPEITMMALASMNVSLIPLAIVFFLLGFFLYAFMFAAMGSTVSRMEDASAAVTVPMLLFVGAFLISISGMADVSADWVRVCSFIPFFAPMVMFMRAGMADVPVLEIIVSIVITAASVFVTGIFAGRVYRTGVMIYGNKPKLKDIVKYMFISN